MFGKWIDEESRGRQASSPTRRNGDALRDPSERTSPTVSSEEGIATNLSADTHFKGSLTFERNLKIEGGFEGDITTSGTLFIGKQARVKAEIHAKDITLEGTVTGNVTATGKLYLKNSAKLMGDIKAGCLVIEEGANVTGHCQAFAEPERRAQDPAGDELSELPAYKIPVETDSSV